MAKKAIAKRSPTLAKLAAAINAEHQACEDGVRDGVCHALEAGKLLTEAKSQMKHGEWLPWLEKNFDGSPDTAERYAKAHGIVTLMGVDSASMRNLPLSEVLALL